MTGPLKMEHLTLGSKSEIICMPLFGIPSHCCRSAVYRNMERRQTDCLSAAAVG